MKDWKKAVGLFIIAIVAIVAGVFCLTVGAVPDWLCVVCAGLGGFLSALGIYWVNPLEKIVPELKETVKNARVSHQVADGRSMLFGRKLE